MTATINTQNKPVMPEQAKPVLKAVDHPFKDKDEQNTVQSIEESAQAEQKADASKVNQTQDTEEAKQASDEALGTAVEQLNTYVQSINRNLEFNIDKDDGRTIVKVIDSETDELIRQIPNEETLQIAKQLDQKSVENGTDAGILLIKARA